MRDYQPLEDLLYRASLTGQLRTDTGQHALSLLIRLNLEESLAISCVVPLDQRIVHERLEVRRQQAAVRAQYSCDEQTDEQTSLLS